MDVQSYLQRIQYGGGTDPTVNTLHRIHRAHLQSVPFENLDIHLGTPIILNYNQLFDKIVGRQRGGFCYELNGLFSRLLRELGFRVTLLSARDAQADGGFGPEFDHLTLRVVCPADPALPAKPWLADVGWGNSFTIPLRLDKTNWEHVERLRVYRIDENGPYRLLWQLNYDGRWEKQYRFSLEPREFSDFETMCRYHQTSPESHFTRKRICTRATANGRLTLSEQRLIITDNGQRQEREVSEEEYTSILREQFGVVL